MGPDLEVVELRPGQSFVALSHGYPYHTVRWHFHPEYELHLVVETTGRYFVGDFIGTFEPGNLVLTGPNLPHNWVSEIPGNVSIPLRCRIVQFGEAFIERAIDLLPEVGAFRPTLNKAGRGVLFGAKTSARVAPLLAEIETAKGIARIQLFMAILDILAQDDSPRVLASESYLPDPSGYMSHRFNKALAFIRENLTAPIDESELAAIAGQSNPAFSRSFRQHTGMSLTQYLRRLRLNLACQILMSEARKSVADICFEVGYNNLSNFNRQFLAEKGMTPTEFRRLTAQNFNSAKAAA